MTTGAQVRFATVADVESIAQLLARGFRGTAPVLWRTMLSYSWLPAADKPDLGAVIEVEGVVGGFLGAMYSDRNINGRAERFCNVYALYVAPEFRQHSIALVALVVNRPGLTFVNVTPADNVLALFKRFGFDFVAKERLVCRGGPRSLLPSRFSPVRLLNEEQVGEDRLGAVAHRIYQDHTCASVRRFPLHVDGKPLLLVTKRVYWSGLKYPRSDLLYASDVDLMTEHWGAVLARVLRSDRTTAMHLDPHLLRKTPKGAKLIEATAYYPSATLFKSASVSRSEIDRLYSELVILP